MYWLTNVTKWTVSNSLICNVQLRLKSVCFIQLSTCFFFYNFFINFAYTDSFVQKKKKKTKISDLSLHKCTSVFSRDLQVNAWPSSVNNMCARQHRPTERQSSDLQTLPWPRSPKKYLTLSFICLRSMKRTSQMIRMYLGGNSKRVNVCLILWLYICPGWSWNGNAYYLTF